MRGIEGFGGSQEFGLRHVICMGEDREKRKILKTIEEKRTDWRWSNVSGWRNEKES